MAESLRCREAIGSGNGLDAEDGSIRAEYLWDMGSTISNTPPGPDWIMVSSEERRFKDNSCVVTILCVRKSTKV